MWPHGRTIVSNEYVLIFVQLFLSAMEMRDYALPACAFHLTYWTQLQCTEGTVSDEPGTQGLQEHARKRASSTIMQRGGYSCTFFCWFKHKKHMSKPPGAECPHHRVSISWHFGVFVCGAWATVWLGSRSRGKKMPKSNISGRHLSCTCHCVRELTLVLSLQNWQWHDSSFYNISKTVTRKIMRTSSSSPIQKFSINNHNNSSYLWRVCCALP